MTVKYETMWKDISFLPCVITNFILEEDWSKVFDEEPDHWVFQNPNNINPGSKVFLPYTLGHHWCLVVLDLRKSTFTHYDSYRSNRDEKIKQRFEKFLEHCRKIKQPGPLNLTSIKHWKLIIPDDRYLRQRDNFNCGVYIIRYMEQIANGVSMREEDFQPNEFRKDLLDFFIRQSSSNICVACGHPEKELQNCIEFDKRLRNIRKCLNCDFWSHEQCRPKKFFVEDVCVVCYNKNFFQRNNNNNEIIKQNQDKSSFQRFLARSHGLPNSKTLKKSEQTSHHQMKNFENNISFKGFMNPDGTNRCWVNSTLQVLFGLSDLFSESFRAWERTRPLEMTFIRTADEWKKKTLSNNLSCEEFKIMCGYYVDQKYLSNTQQDVAEFLTKFFQNISWQNEVFNPNNDKLREDIFSIKKVKFRECQNCLSSSSYDEPTEFIVTNLHVKPHTSLDTLFNESFQDQIEMDCSKCGEALVNHSVTSKLLTYPKVLVIQLERYQESGFQKNRTALEILEDLFLTPYYR